MIRIGRKKIHFVTFSFLVQPRFLQTRKRDKVVFFSLTILIG